MSLPTASEVDLHQGVRHCVDEEHKEQQETNADAGTVQERKVCPYDDFSDLNAYDSCSVDDTNCKPNGTFEDKGIQIEKKI